jgi:hypothetical protein
MAINTEKYDGVHYQVVLMNMRDGSVQGHAAGCADLKRGKAKFAEPSQADEVWDVEVKEDAREAYNADFDEETDGWYDIEWLPCAKHIPAHREVTEEAPVEETPAPQVTTRVGRKWTYVFVDGEEVAYVRNDMVALVLATLGA